MDSAAVMGRNTMTYQTIDLVDAAQTKLRSLSLSQQQTVIDFIEFLASKQVVESDKPQDKSPRVFGLHAGMGEIHDDEHSKQQRIPDLDKGKYWMSDDFDAPLPDEFWLGED
jgi:Protein of unknown function (DUF2281)